MESSKPNSLTQALAAQKPTGEHPDADVLNAFVEGSLLERERETVMAHLAACAPCRAVASLSATEPVPERDLAFVAAAAPMAAAKAPVVPRSLDRVERAKRRVWMPWAAAAAACLAIVSAAVVHYAHKTPEQTAMVREQAAQPALPESSKTVAAIAPPAAPVPGAAMEQAQRDMKLPQKSEAKDKLAIAGAPEKKMLSAKTESRGSVGVSKPAMTPATIPDPLLATNQAVVRAEQQVTAEASREVSAQNSLQQTKNAQFAQQRGDLRSAQTQAEAAVQAPRATTPALGGAFAKNTNAAFIPGPRWRINAQGHLERAFSAGQWEPALANETTPMHVVSVAGGTVWAGGENDVVYRSDDEGATWQKIALPEKDGAHHTIVHIRFENASAGAIAAEDGTRWATTDGGATWK